MSPAVTMLLLIAMFGIVRSRRRGWRVMSQRQFARLRVDEAALSDVVENGVVDVVIAFAQGWDDE